MRCGFERRTPLRHLGDIAPARVGIGLWIGAVGLILTVLCSASFSQAQEAAVEPAPADEPAAAADRAIDIGQPVAIEVFPPEFHLATPRRTLHLAVTARYADESVRDVTRAATFQAADPALLKIEGNVARPLADGRTAVVVELADHVLSVPVLISGQDQAEPVSFLYGAQVALTKQGCNSGACHGSPSGKGGFRLSLRAYDPVLDALTLVREVFNRRTNVEEPEASLLLRKPLMEVPHGGGRRLVRESASFELLHDWIAGGMSTAEPEAVCTHIEIYPPRRVLRHPAREQRLIVLGHFSDGSVRDITEVADYSSSDEAVATVDEHGLVAAEGRGETAVLVRYLEHMQTSYLTFLEDVEGFVWSAPPDAGRIDELVWEKLAELQILPSETCTDDEFLRRVYLDVTGQLPTVAETEAFLADPDPERRTALVDHLLQRPEFAEFWGQRWADLLRVSNKQLSSSGVYKFNRWIVSAWRDNVPYDEFVRELLTASGSTFDHPAANFYRAAADVNDCTETTAQLFLGIRIQCAKCHNHPFERWTQDNYYGIAAFFNRVERKPGPRGDELVVWMGRSGEVTQPRTGQQMKPWLPLAGDAEIPAEADRREQLVSWLFEPENPFFAAAEVNRIWGYLLGRGIVEPVDDFRASNPPSNAALLDELARELVASGFDRRHVIRQILLSRTYQASSRANAFNQDDVKYFSHARTRLLSAEQLLDAICRVTEVDEKYAGLPAGTRATALPSPDVNHDFLKVFGQPAREMACQCERSSESNLSQALQMINGPLVHGKLTHDQTRVRRLVAEGHSDEAIVRELYLAGLCREPTEGEQQAALAHIAAQSDRLLALEDVCWALLNSKEFLFQH